MPASARAQALEPRSDIKSRATWLTPFIYILIAARATAQRIRLMQHTMPAS